MERLSDGRTRGYAEMTAIARQWLSTYLNLFLIIELQTVEADTIFIPYFVGMTFLGITQVGIIISVFAVG